MWNSGTSARGAEARTGEKQRWLLQQAVPSGSGPVWLSVGGTSIRLLLCRRCDHGAPGTSALERHLRVAHGIEFADAVSDDDERAEPAHADVREKRVGDIVKLQSEVQRFATGAVTAGSSTATSRDDDEDNDASDSDEDSYSSDDDVAAPFRPYASMVRYLPAKRLRRCLRIQNTEQFVTEEDRKRARPNTTGAVVANEAIDEHYLVCMEGQASFDALVVAAKAGTTSSVPNAWMICVRFGFDEFAETDVKRHWKRQIKAFEQDFAATHNGLLPKKAEDRTTVADIYRRYFRLRDKVQKSGNSSLQTRQAIRAVVTSRALKQGDVVCVDPASVARCGEAVDDEELWYRRQASAEVVAELDEATKAASGRPGPVHRWRASLPRWTPGEPYYHGLGQSTVDPATPVEDPQHVGAGIGDGLHPTVRYPECLLDIRPCLELGPGELEVVARAPIPAGTAFAYSGDLVDPTRRRVRSDGRDVSTLRDTPLEGNSTDRFRSSEGWPSHTTTTTMLRNVYLFGESYKVVGGGIMRVVNHRMNFHPEGNIAFCILPLEPSITISSAKEHGFSRAPQNSRRMVSEAIIEAPVFVATADIKAGERLLATSYGRRYDALLAHKHTTASLCLSVAEARLQWRAQTQAFEMLHKVSRGYEAFHRGEWAGYPVVVVRHTVEDSEACRGKSDGSSACLDPSFFPLATLPACWIRRTLPTTRGTASSWDCNHLAVLREFQPAGPSAVDGDFLGTGAQLTESGFSLEPEQELSLELVAFPPEEKRSVKLEWEAKSRRDMMFRIRDRWCIPVETSTMKKNQRGKGTNYCSVVLPRTLWTDLAESQDVMNFATAALGLSPEARCDGFTADTLPQPRRPRRAS